MVKKTVNSVVFVVLVLQVAALTVLLGGASFVAQAATPETWTTTGTLNTARASHTATHLNDGRVLVAGGMDSNGNPLASCELYNPTTGTWTATVGTLNHARLLHTATLLNDGRVLVAGGFNWESGLQTICEIYDPIRDVWDNATSLNDARIWNSATLLKDGRVLVAGGWNLGSGDLTSAAM